MNYPHLQTYLKNNVVITVSFANGHAQDVNKVQNLNNHFLTAKGLQANDQLKQVLTRFYDSVTAMIASDEQYYPLPAYESLTANYFTTNKPNLGIKSNNQIEAAIAEEHYQLLDQILLDFQALPQEKKPQDDPNDHPLAVTLLQNQALTLQAQISELLKAKTTTNLDVNLMAELVRLFGQEMQQQGQTEPDFAQLLMTKKNPACQPLFKVLLTYPASKDIVTGIKAWLVDYQQLSQTEKELVKTDYQVLNKLNQIIVSCQGKDSPTEEETQPPKAEIKHKEELLYFGGFIVLLAVVAMLFKK